VAARGARLGRVVPTSPTPAANVNASAPGAPFVTPAAWAEAQLPFLPEILVEQAHLEKKAAAAAVQFLFRLPSDGSAQRRLSALAREELSHFERTLKLLAARRIAFAPQAPSPYAERLKTAVARTMPERLADELLVAAVIEARSHERLELLAHACERVDPELAAFEHDLVAAEARHAPLYVELAALVLPAGGVDVRHRALLAHEATVLRALPFAPRLHSGVPAGA
jgi:tRNA-(ms[2]io[6]A)-hydroxylase